jgi:hypothetical protein
LADEEVEVAAFLSLRTSLKADGCPDESLDELCFAGIDGASGASGTFLCERGQ